MGGRLELRHRRVRQARKDGRVFCENSPTRRKQSGVALISVLLIFVIATLVAVEMTERSQLMIRKTANILANDQGQVYARGAESFAMLSLQKLLDENPEVATLASASLPPMVVEEGVISGHIVDLQSRFNINSLANVSEVGGSTNNSSTNDSSGNKDPQYEAFVRLLTALGLGGAEAEDIGSAIVDWIDENDQPYQLSGVEDDHYLLLERPYRTANQPVTDLSELRLVRGMSEEIFQQIIPYLSALPDDALVNLNTASVEVLMSLDSDITAAIANQVIEEREANPLGELPDGFKDNDISVANVVYGSEYYEIYSRADILERSNFLVSTLFLPSSDSETPKVLRRKKIPSYLAAQMLSSFETVEDGANGGTEVE